MRNYLIILVVLFSVSTVNAQYLHHDFNIDINTDKNSLSVYDTISGKKEIFLKDGKISFYLNADLALKSLDKNVIISEIAIDDNDEMKSDKILPVKKYEIQLGDENDSELLIPIFYEGIINDEITTGAAEYARGFSETRGVISDNGVYLAGSSFWKPYFSNIDLMTYNLNVVMDSAWEVVSQGTRTKNETVSNKKHIRYESPEPMDEIYLIAGKWSEYSVNADKVLVQAFLRTPDENLANRYLKVTSNYIKLYESLIGKYPFTKFALVENFWETGYGMPSFTLLGEKVIRFPWILHSSYPHELLHNYWGNSVYVDYEDGNWCEGITVYMADHLIKEQQGQGEVYRRTTLQKYTDYVNSENDFPVSEFLNRNNSAEEAVGYGKSMMFNNMLRYEFGDEVFLTAYSKFYTDNKFKKASFNDIRKSFEEVTGKDLKPFFEQWITRKGAPTLSISKSEVVKAENNYTVKFTLSQSQDEDVFDINIPVILYLDGSDEVIVEKVNLNEREKEYTFSFEKQPLKIEIDPQFNIFRRLDKKEVPPTLSQVMGSKKTMIVLPKSSEIMEGYKQLAETWQSIQKAQGKEIEIVFDTDISSIPTDKAVWIFGFDNKYADKVQFSASYNDYLKDNNGLQKVEEAKKQGSLVYVITNPENEAQTIGFLATNIDKALIGLSRKLLHYGKYSYLGFEGEAPDNILKGFFPALNSPLNVLLNSDGEDKVITAKLKSREALSRD